MGPVPTPKPPFAKIIERAYVTDGLGGQDDNIVLLEEFFKEMQKTTVETSQPDDFLTFASCAHFFGVVMLETTTIPVIEDSDDDEEEDEKHGATTPRESAPEGLADEGDESVYPASSRATTPPGSSAPSVASYHTTRIGTLDEISANSSSDKLIPVMSEQEKVLLWREAFMARLEQSANEPIPPSNLYRTHEQDVAPIYSGKGKFPEYYSGFAAPDSEHHIAEASHEDASDLINWPDEGPSNPGARTYDSYDPPDFPMDISSPHPGYDMGSEAYSSPARGPLDLPPADPDLQAFVLESAVRFQEILRTRTIQRYQKLKLKEQKRKSTPPPPPEPTKTVAPIGLIYLWTSQTFLDPLHMGECSLGIYIIPEHRGKDCLVDAANEVVDLAFRDPECRRLQSIIVENPDKLYNLELLARTGFRNEGIRRRAFFSSVACEWKDVTYFAMLVTDYVYDKNSEDSAVRLRPKSLWDEVFTRHQTECDDLVRLEERSNLKRSNSVETIREITISASASYVSESERDGDMTDTSSSIPSTASSKRRKMSTHESQHGTSRSTATSSVISTSSGLDSDWEVTQPGPPTRRKHPFPRTSVGASTSGYQNALKKSSGARSGSSASSSWSVLSD